MIGKAGVGQGRDRMSCSQGALKGSHQWLGLTSLSPVARAQLLEHCRQQMALDVGRPLRRLPQFKVEVELGASREYREAAQPYLRGLCMQEKRRSY